MHIHRDRLITNTIIFTYNFTTKDSSKSVSINEQATTKRKQERTLRGIPKTRDRPPQRMEKSQATNQETIKIRIKTRVGRRSEHNNNDYSDDEVYDSRYSQHNSRYSRHNDHYNHDYYDDRRHYSRGCSNDWGGCPNSILRKRSVSWGRNATPPPRSCFYSEEESPCRSRRSFTTAAAPPKEMGEAEEVEEDRPTEAEAASIFHLLEIT